VVRDIELFWIAISPLIELHDKLKERVYAGCIEEQSFVEYDIPSPDITRSI
jgi:hypothetical protein